MSATQLLVEANLKNAEFQDSLTVVWARVAELEDWKRLAELERAEGLTQLDKAQARVEVLEARSDWCPVCNGGLPDQSGEGGSDGNG